MPSPVNLSEREGNRPDGRTLAAALHDGQIKLWRGASDDELRQIEQSQSEP